jgi:hypothetical protein
MPESDNSTTLCLQIAFSSVSITLRHYVEDMASGNWHLHHGEQDNALVPVAVLWLLFVLYSSAQPGKQVADTL